MKKHLFLPQTFSIFLLLLLFSCKKDEAEISLPPAPVAAFSMSKSTAEVGDVIEFTNESVHATDYSWTFGDGTTSFAVSPVHPYTDHGDFTITLIATGEGGSDTTSATLTVEAPALPPIGTYSGSTAEGGSIRFSINTENKVVSFNGTYFLTSGNGNTYEVSMSMPSYGTMTATADGFTVTNAWGKTLTGRFEDDTITGTWEHDFGITAYEAVKL